MAIKRRGRPSKKTDINAAQWKYLSLDGWRSNKSCVEYSKRLLRDPMFLIMLGMLNNYAVERKSIPIDQLAINIEFGRSEGRKDILNAIEVSSIPTEVSEQSDDTKPYEEVESPIE